MNDEHYYADVDLPFHVWVREGKGRGFRWVLRHAADVQRGSAQRAAAAGDAPQGAPRATP